MKTKIEIKSVFGILLFEFEKENNSVKETLMEAVYSNANLSNADLRYADLRYASLSGAALSNANLVGASLSGADLSNADLSNADLRYASLGSANLGGANLGGANLSGANYNESTSFLLNQCPSEGSFIGWKKANNYIVKLLITENAKRLSATSLKCRCSEAKVMEIQNIDGSVCNIKEVSSSHDSSFIYKVGEIVIVDNFDENRYVECSTGIHFFISREMAVKY